MKKFSDMGVDTKKTPFEVAEDSDVVITMLPSSSHVSLMFPFTPFFVWIKIHSSVLMILLKSLKNISVLNLIKETQRIKLLILLTPSN